MLGSCRVKWPSRGLLARALAQPAKSNSHAVPRWLAATGPASSAFIHTNAATRLPMEVKMPSLSPTMTEGSIVKWNYKPGDSITAGEVLAEIQTDKAVVALEADEDGVMAKILMEEGSAAVKVGTLIAVLAEDGEDWQEVSASALSAEESSPAAAVDSTADSGARAEGPSGGNTPGIEVNMPSLSPTMTEGTIVKWCVEEGATLQPGDVLCEVQTDKAVVSMEWDDEAILAKILVQPGEDAVPVGRLIALMVNPDEDWKDVQIPAPTAVPKTEEAKTDSAPKSDVSSPPAASTQPAVSGHEFEHLKNVGPATLLLMAQYGIKSSELAPSGPKGLLKTDVLAHIQSKNLRPIKVTSMPPPGAAGQVKEAPASTAAPSKPKSGYTDLPLSSMRAVIAKRLTESKQTSPHGHCTVATDLAGIMRIRKDYKAAGIKVSLNDLIIKATGTALQHVPEMNLNVSGEDFQIMPTIDVSVAVATDAGLITPIVKNVPAKSVDEISAEVKDLAKRARDGKLKLDEFQGGTFTISNLGMFGIHEFTAIINPPQVGIIAVGSGSEEVDPITGQVKNIMRSTLSFDRRFVDEALAADFMATFQRVIEQPEYLNLQLPNVVRRQRSQLEL